MALSKESLLRAKKVRKSTSLHTPNCIAAIDIGTSSVSLAYTTPCCKDGKIEILKLDNDELRVTNAMLIRVNEGSNQCTVEEVGNLAQAAYCDAHIKQQHKYFQWIMTNFGMEEINRNTTVPSFTGGNYYLLEVIAFIIKYLKDVLLYYLIEEDLEATDFDWVITVPAIWKARARRMMREAAYLAGLTCDNGGITKFTDTSRGTLPRPLEVNPHKLTLALEPEAAAIYAHHSVILKSTPFPSHIHHQHTPPPPRYMVVDIGGGTVNITVHDRSDGKIDVISYHLVSGGNAINEAFRNLIEIIVQDEQHKNFLASHETAKAALNKLYYQEFEEQKKKFGHEFQNTFSPTEEAAIILPRSFVKFYGEQRIAEGCQKMGIKCDTNDMLCIKYSLLEEKVFQITIDGIIRCVRDALQQVHGRGVNTLYLVGGFGGCQFVERQLRNDLGDTINMICPQQADLAVTIGAVMWRQAPDIIQSRIADATYGIGVAPEFDSQKHKNDYRFKDEDGVRRCRDVLEVIVVKGEIIGNEVYKTHLIPPKNSDDKMTISIYATTQGIVQYVVDKKNKSTVQKIGELNIKLLNPYNDPRNKRVVDVFISFHGTEIHAKARYRITGKEAIIVCDLVSYTQEDQETTTLLQAMPKTDTPHRITTSSDYHELQESLLQSETAKKEIQQKLETATSNLQHLVTMANSWQISNENLMLTSQELCRGAWGVIWIGQFRGQNVAVKQIHENIAKIPQFHQLLFREINIMAQLRHPNLLQFIGAVFDHPSGNPMIITEVMDTSLRKAYEKKELTPDQQPVILSIMRDVAVGLNYLHSLPDPIIHRDVSSANVLLESKGPGKWKTKISDFGSAKLAKLAVTQLPGTPVYSAPEVSGSITTQDETKQTTKLDIFSYGILLCEITTCTFPINPDTFRKSLAQLNITNTGALINWCIQKEPNNRPTAQQVIEELDHIKYSLNTLV